MIRFMNRDRKENQIITDEEAKEIVNDGYTVRVKLKDTSTYAFAPRRFVHVEQLQLRKITDIFLKRGIIKPNISLYCAKVVPVKKKRTSQIMHRFKTA